MQLQVKIQPNAKKNAIVGPLSDGTIKIKIASPPLDGRANKSLIEFLAKEYNVPKTQIAIIKGEKSKNKIIEINKKVPV